MFVIGLPKTGTTSLHIAFKLLGLRSFHSGGSRADQAVLHAQQEGERLLHDVGERFDAYSDVETLSVRFDLADLQYPGSQFIFTVRDVDEWIASRRRHAERNEQGRRDGSYAGRNLGIHEETWRENLEHATRSCDDLVSRARRSAGSRRLRRRGLGTARRRSSHRPVPVIPFPRENVDGEVSRRFARWRGQSRERATSERAVASQTSNDPKRWTMWIRTAPRRCRQSTGSFGLSSQLCAT